MRIEIFRSDDGDCLLLESDGGRRVLVDGGKRPAYQRNVARWMGRLRDEGETIDLVVVSHIDQDHVAGILELMDNEAAWRVHEFQKAHGNPGHKKPKAPRPAEVEALWHNAFRDQVADNEGKLDEIVIATMRAHLLEEESDGVLELANLVTSKREALLLAHRLSKAQLGIPVNGPAEGKLMIASADADSIPLGDLTFEVLAPHREALDQLRDDWNDWLEDKEETIRRIREEAREEAERLHADEGATFRASLSRLAASLGDRSNVTTPNLASLVLWLEDGAGRTVLLTGDSHAQDILEGLELRNKLNGQGPCHVDVLKVQHHGSEHNLDRPFCRKVVAEHYVFCGDGNHENPDLEVVEAVIEERLGFAGSFRLWFNSSSKSAIKPERRKHMEKIEKLVRKLQGKNPGRFRYRFLTQGSKLSLTL